MSTVPAECAGGSSTVIDVEEEKLTKFAATLPKYTSALLVKLVPVIVTCGAYPLEGPTLGVRELTVGAGSNVN
jgi:hypothetical protein